MSELLPHLDALTIARAVKKLDPAALVRAATVPVLDEDLAGFGYDTQEFLRDAAKSAPREVANYAALYSRPRCPGLPEPRPVRLRNGWPAIKRTITRADQAATQKRQLNFDEPCRASRGRQYPHGAFCPINWKPDPETVLRERARYLVWWSALRCIAMEHGAMLSELHLVTPAARQFPWLSQTVWEAGQATM